MATNRIETLDPALIRPGRIDRKIEFPLPDEKTKRRIFSIHTNRMTLAEDVSLEDYVMAKDDLSGADIKVRSTLYLCSYLCTTMATVPLQSLSGYTFYVVKLITGVLLPYITYFSIHVLDFWHQIFTNC